MPRFNNIKAKFYNKSNLSLPLTDTLGQAHRLPISAEATRYRSDTGTVSLVFTADDYLFDLAVEGRICAVTYSDSVAPSGATYLPFGLPFVIDSIEPLNDGKVRVSGSDLLTDLKNRQLFAPIGKGINTATTVAVTVPDPVFTTLLVGAPNNNDSATLTSVSGWQVGDEVRITMNGGIGVHTTVVTSINPPASPAGTIQIRDRLPADAAAGNTVEKRQRAVQVAAGKGSSFQTGVECRLILDNGSTHLTLIADDPDGDVIIMTDGAPDGAAVGKSITATDYSEPATNDVSMIVAKANSWTAYFESPSYSGTANGTYHAPQGDSVYDLLQTTVQRSGEFFRMEFGGLSEYPNRIVRWRRTADYAGSGGSLRLVQPGLSDIANEAANYNRAIITGVPSRTTFYSPVTRVTPYAGDKRITLLLCTEGAKLDALARGYEVVTTGLGLYDPPYVKDSAADIALGRIDRTITLSEIRVETNKVREWQSAADSLLVAAVNFMREHGTQVRYQYEVPGVVCAVPVWPGQRVEMVYTAPDGSWSINRTGSNALYVLKVKQTINEAIDDGERLSMVGVPLTTLTLVESPLDVPGMERATAGAIQQVGRIARQGVGGSGGGTSTVIASGGTATDHGTLSGLGDDDHPQYVRTDGTRTMTGDLTLADGVRVDGVDISAHAADPNAHHAAVTLANTGLSLSGQAVGLNLASPSAFEIADGLRFAAAAAGPGLKLTSQILAVNLAAASGLSLTGNALAVGTPGALTAVTTNSVTATSHTHAVTASAAPGASTQLLKTNIDGHLELQSLSLGTPGDSTAALKIIPWQANKNGLLLRQKTGQTAQLFRIEKADTTALLLVTNDGNLESGAPGFVSGLTGWQIKANGDAEFNNVRVRGELHATTFVADEMHATGGTMQLATATTIAEPDATNNNRLAAIDNITSRIMVTASWATGLCYFAPKDIIRIKSMGEVSSGGSLYIPDIYLEVYSVTAVGDRNLAQGKPGRYRLSCARKSGGYTGYLIPTGAAAVLWTRSGQPAGSYKGNMLLTADLADAPYIDVFTVDSSRAHLAAWPGSGETRTPPQIKPRVRVGNLDGVLGLPEQWGIAAGADLSDTSSAARYIVASDLGVKLKNVDIEMYTGNMRSMYLSTLGIDFRAEDSYLYQRNITWQRPSGVMYAALSGLSTGDSSSLSIGVQPTFNQTTMIDHGMEMKLVRTLPAGNFQHYTRIMSWGTVDVGGSHSIRLAAPYIDASPMRIFGGLLVGDPASGTPGGSINIPPTGVLRFKERANSITPPATTSDLFVIDDGTRQILYIRFDNGVLRELARST